MSDELPGDDATIAVVAHRLLNSVAVAAGAVQTLAESDGVLTVVQRADIADAALRHLDHLTAVLRDLVLGVPSTADAAALELTAP